MKVTIIDYGMSNLGSIRQAIEECGGDVEVSDDPHSLAASTHIILPGVGAFYDGMKNLRERGWIEPIRKAALEDGVPFLGICLGQQLIADSGDEGGQADGLGLVPGTIKKFQQTEKKERIPHIGWNEVTIVQPDDIFTGVPDHTDFYFVHSYYFDPKDQQSVIGTTPYCGSFASVIKNKNVYGTQFHPEKSQRAGFTILKNFLAL